MASSRYFFVKRKSFMTLLETLIAASLLAVLLTIVFGFFRELSVLSLATEHKQRENFRSRYLEARLSSVFDRIVNERDRGRTFFFYTRAAEALCSSTSLIFTFDNGIGADPLYSGDVLGRLYLDNARTFDSDKRGEPSYNLVLAIWPLHVDRAEEFVRKEVLFEGIVEMHFEFYAAPERLTNAKAVVSGAKTPAVSGGGGILATNAIAPERNRWHEDIWSIEYQQMPSIVRISLTVKKSIGPLEKIIGDSNSSEMLTFNFVLPSSKNPVHYPADALP